MAKTEIAGKDFKLFIEKDGEYIIFGCTDDATLNLESDTLSAACKDDDTDGWEVSAQGMKRWSVDFSGLYRIITAPDDETNFSALELFDLFVSGAPANIRLGPDAEGAVQFSGVGKVFNMSISAPAEELTTFSGTFTGQGALVTYTVPVVP